MTNIDSRTESLLISAYENEVSVPAKSALKIICENICCAREDVIPVCQDTGMAIVYLNIGQEVFLSGEYLEDQINSAVREAYKENYYRMSITDPISRKNTGDNTPAVIHTQIVKGDRVEISFLSKGFGSENMSQLIMLKPSDGVEGIINAVISSVVAAGGNPCPPVTVGVGIGGTADKATELSKKALLRPTGEKSPDKELAELESLLLKKINQSEVGAQGFGGNNTAIAVHIEKFATHIAGLPVAVNLNCHAVRVRKAVI